MGIRGLLPVALSIAACGGTAPLQSFAGLTRVTGSSPFAPGCVSPGQTGTNFPSAEVEPFLAIDPRDSQHLVGVWQQDRWSTGGSNGLGSGVSLDGGKTWKTGFAHFTRCSGGTAANGANFQRASDPWITFGADSTPHQIGFSFDNSSAHTAMLAVRSADGGFTWTEPLVLFEENNPDTNIDKESITADPADARLVYAVWDRLTGIQTPGSPSVTGPTWFTRTTDGGASWEKARIIYDPGPNEQTIGNQIVVLPNGHLVDLFTHLKQLDQPSSPAAAEILRSADQGQTWLPSPDRIAAMTSQGVADPKDPSKWVRTGDLVPEIAVDRQSGALYVVWEDSRFSSGARDGIAISTSTDEGRTWSAPARVNGAPDAQAFTPAIAVAQGGRIGVTYYDLRNDHPGDNSRLLATAWLAISTDGGASFQESALGGPFDLRSAARTTVGTRESYFIGDYQGLVTSGAGFLPFLVLTNEGNASNRSDVFSRPPTAGLAASVDPLPLTLALGRGFASQRPPRTGPQRSY